MVFVVGRGHNGTRLAAQFVRSADVFLGSPLNSSMDLMPMPNLMYDGARMAVRRMRLDVEPYRLDVERLHREEVPGEFVEVCNQYLEDGHLVRFLETNPGKLAGFKLPELTLCFPWLVRLFPAARFVLWGRDPRGTIRTPHGTDNLGSWGLEGWPEDLSPGAERALSWAVQTAVVLSVQDLPERVMFTSLEEVTAVPRRVLRKFEVLLGGRPEGVSVQPEVAAKWQRCRPVAAGTPEIALALQTHRHWERAQGWSPPS